MLPFAEDPFTSPSGKVTAISVAVFSALVGAVCLYCLFLPREKLQGMAAVIGSKNPVVARVVCVVLLLIAAGGVAAGVFNLLGKP